jgi:hypothetical protein
MATTSLRRAGGDELSLRATQGRRGLSNRSSVRARVCGASARDVALAIGARAGIRSRPHLHSGGPAGKRPATEHQSPRNDDDAEYE